MQAYGGDVAKVAEHLGHTAKWVRRWASRKDSCNKKGAGRQYQAAVQRAWAEITAETCLKLTNSMAYKVEKLVENNGGHIERTVYR